MYFVAAWLRPFGQNHWFSHEKITVCQTCLVLCRSQSLKQGSIAKWRVSLMVAMFICLGWRPPVLGQQLFIVVGACKALHLFHKLSGRVDIQIHVHCCGSFGPLLPPTPKPFLAAAASPWPENALSTYYVFFRRGSPAGLKHICFCCPPRGSEGQSPSRWAGPSPHHRRCLHRVVANLRQYFGNLQHPMVAR